MVMGKTLTGLPVATACKLPALSNLLQRNRYLPPSPGWPAEYCLCFLSFFLFFFCWGGGVISYQTYSSFMTEIQITTTWSVVNGLRGIVHLTIFQELTNQKGQGSRRVKIGPIAEIYDFLICCRIIYLMKKNVIFICFALKLCDTEADK